MTKLLTLDAILGAGSKPAFKDVDIATGTIRLQAASENFDAVGAFVSMFGKSPNMVRACTVAGCIVDENGERVFTTEDHVKGLGKLDHDTMKTLFGEASALMDSTTKKGIEAKKD